MNSAELLVAALENEGVGRIFGIPGEENLDIVEAVRRSSIDAIGLAVVAGGAAVVIAVAAGTGKEAKDVRFGAVAAVS